MYLGPQDKPVIILKVSLTPCTKSTKRPVLIGIVDNLLPFLLKNLRLLYWLFNSHICLENPFCLLVSYYN